MFSTNRAAAIVKRRFAANLSIINAAAAVNCDTDQPKVLILHGSLTGTAEALAIRLSERLLADCSVAAISTFNKDVDDLVITNENLELSSKPAENAVSCIARFESIVSDFDYLVVCISTWVDGNCPPGSEELIEFLDDLHSDFRVGKDYFSSMIGSAVIGLGNREYDQFCTPAIHIEKTLKALGSAIIVPLWKVNEAYDASAQSVNEWLDIMTRRVVSRIKVSREESVGLSVLKGCCTTSPGSAQSTDCACRTSGDDPADNSSDSEEDGSLEGDIDTGGCGTEDLEDLGKPVANNEMLTTRQREQLVKEGYKIVGSHSAVKLCRWTKSQLRGRGGCYKHTFYGIQSYLCMEATPSLACANKCVFCWRHHKNPVGKAWKWKTDSAQQILDGVKREHQQMIKQLRGVVGVKPERFIEAATAIRHCALSLVGEPIMYPQLVELIQGMHNDKISTFLVTNAQFPEEMRTLKLKPVTQLYVSIDAATPESLKIIGEDVTTELPLLQCLTRCGDETAEIIAVYITVYIMCCRSAASISCVVDRPLHSDFWERFLECLDIIRETPSRTVFRLTLVKKYNMEEASCFGQLILRGAPDLIEIKAVTYAGNSGKSTDITMADIPWHDEVVSYAEAIIGSNPEVQSNYAVACEHRHSCCILIAHKRLMIGGRWHTWIDYDKFFQLAESGDKFTTLDYCSPTPSWAVIGADERGFDPAEERVYTKGKNKKKNCVDSVVAVY